jgi:hypothetical protein
MLGIAIAKDETAHAFPYVFLYYTRPSTSTDSNEDNEDNDENVELDASNYLYRYELINNKLDVLTGSVAAELRKSESDNTKAQNIDDGLDPGGRGGILTLSQDGGAVLQEEGEDYILGSKYL